MALINTKIAVHWKNPKGENRLKIYNNLTEAERAKKWLVKQGISVADIEIAGDSKLRRWPEQPPVLAPTEPRSKNAKKRRKPAPKNL